ncbi:MAG: hypothetical protein RML93_03815, partial [Anaerolineales bacterium]|nr:hypothetical protein [Anaerolineales bacterium]MDW8446403.1 hypothetical protein [Anaerolineales bacterium]
MTTLGRRTSPRESPKDYQKTLGYQPLRPLGLRECLWRALGTAIFHSPHRNLFGFFISFQYPLTDRGGCNA